MAKNDVVLFRYQVVLQPDGSIRSDVAGISAEEFTKAADEANAEWQETPVIARGLEYLNKFIGVFDDDFGKFLKSL